MKILVATFLLAIAAMPAFSAADKNPLSPRSNATISRPSKQLRNFKSKRELRGFLAKLRQQYRNRVGHGSGNGSGVGSGDGLSMSATVTVTSDDASGSGGGGGEEPDETITNVQETGVDEGSIVKLRGNYLVILRRGRLFTIDISKDDLKPISTINAYSPDTNPENTWYDEMLISKNHIAVIGYSYDRGGTEIGLFKLEADGRLSYHSTYHLRSNDYYSSRNYSSRLIGNKLIFYSPLNLDLEERDPLDSFPALRRWHKGASKDEFRSIAPATNIYIPSEYKVNPEDVTLHTVTTCEIRTELSCTAESVIGPSGNVFYVSSRNVYVWASTWESEESTKRNRSLLFRMPLLEGGPSAIRVSGSPVDQLSFHEEEEEGLHVLVRANSKGDGMWKSEIAEGEVALLRLQARDFGNGSKAAGVRDYQQLEKPNGYSFQNRFIGDYVLYGAADYSAEHDEVSNLLFALNRKTGAFSKVKLPHDVRRLDLLGKDGIVIGNVGENLVFTSVILDGSPQIVDSYTIGRAAQGETRSQGFFYKPIDGTNGMLGLPVVRTSEAGPNKVSRELASVVFLRNSDLRFHTLGELTSYEPGSINDDCKASCVDWYGNARPIFVKGRIFALLGYELVDAQIVGGQLSETRRVNFAPARTSGGN